MKDPFPIGLKPMLVLNLFTELWDTINMFDRISPWNYLGRVENRIPTKVRQARAAMTQHPTDLMQNRRHVAVFHIFRRNNVWNKNIQPWHTMAPIVPQPYRTAGQAE